MESTTYKPGTLYSGRHCKNIHNTNYGVGKNSLWPTMAYKLVTNGIIAKRKMQALCNQQNKQTNA